MSNSSNPDEEDFDLSPYNQTGWRRLESAFGVVRRSSEVHMIAASLIIVSAIPVNLFLIFQILRKRHRRTVINYLIVVSSIAGLVSLAHLVVVLLSNYLLCTSTYMVFPSLMLFQKLILTSLAVVRHLYIFCNTLLFDGGSTNCFFFMSLITSGILAASPGLTQILDEFANPLWKTCLLISDTDNAGHSYVFTFTFYVLFLNSLVVDVVCYARILNYIRKNRVSVSVIATSPNERSKAHNIVTAPSSFLIWLIMTVSMLPSSLLFIKSAPSLNADHTVTLLNYETVLTFIFATAMPVIYIGSSAELRKDAYLLKRFLCPKLDSHRQRQEVYTIDVLN